MDYNSVDNTSENFLILLRNNIVNLKFKKKSGEIRNMRATLNSDLIKYDYKETTQPSKEIPVDDNILIKVYDLDILSFRSFYFNSLISYEIE